jgi:hypothetical protein
MMGIYYMNRIVLSLSAVFLFGVLLVANSGANDYVWIDSDPPGASIVINGEVKGTTPKFVNNLDAGTFAVVLTKDGFEPLTRNVEVPGPPEKQVFNLQQKSGTCLITSEPTAVSVFSGTQLLGRTPFLLQGYEAGSYTFKLAKPGFEPVELEAMINEGQATQATATLENNTGGVEIVTIPAGVKVVIDGEVKGVTKAVDTLTNKSEALVLAGFKHGNHKIYLDYNGVKSPEQPLVIEKATNTKKLLMLWYPGIRVTKKTGSAVTGMLIQKNDLGDVVLVTGLNANHTRIPATQIETVEKLSLADVKKVLKGGR